MNIRLTANDLDRVGEAKQHFASLRPVPVHLGTAEVVRIALRELTNRLKGGASPTQAAHANR